MDVNTPGFSAYNQSPELAQTYVHRVSDAIKPFHPLLSSSPPDFNLSQHQSFPMSCLFLLDGQSIGTSNFSIILSSEYSGLASFWIDWFDFLVVQETLKSLLQHHSLKASILSCSTSFMVQLPHLYMAAGKTTCLTRQNFVGKVISLLYNALPRFY